MDMSEEMTDYVLRDKGAKQTPDLKSCNSFRLSDEQISKLKNIKYIFSEKDKLARFNPENILLKDLNHDEDIIILEDVGHFPYFESPEGINKALEKLINSSN